MNRASILLLICLAATTLCAEPAPQKPAWKSTSAFAAHTTLGVNIGTLIGLKIAKERAYKKLRATLLDQITKEAEQEASKNNDSQTGNTNGPTALEILTHIKTAPKKALTSIAQDIIERRKAYEQLYGNYVLAEQLGATRNEQEKAAVALYKSLTAKIGRYEKLIPQLSFALLGTTTASTFSLLRQVGFLS